MVAITVAASSQHAQAIPPGKQVILQGSLPGEGTLKGQTVSIKVVADDGTHRRHIRLTKKIGEGGEGSVFETDLATKSSYVAKIYSRRKLVDTKIDKIKLMLTKSIGLAGVCFPVALIKNEQSETVGFLMPRANGVELGKSVFMPKLLQLKFPSWTRRDTIQLCITILEKIKYLNERGIILGDINGQNILIVSPTEVFFRRLRQLSNRQVSLPRGYAALYCSRSPRQRLQHVLTYAGHGKLCHRNFAFHDHAPR